MRSSGKIYEGIVDVEFISIAIAANGLSGSLDSNSSDKDVQISRKVTGPANFLLPKSDKTEYHWR